MKHTYLISTLTLATGFIPMASHAAIITWLSPTNISGDSDVSTEGDFVFAASFYTLTTSTTVNGVTFSGGGNISDMADSSPYGTDLTYNFYDANDTAFTSAVEPYSKLSADYQTLLQSAILGQNNGGALTLTLGDLTLSQEYQLQIWVNDPRGGGVASRYTTITDGPVLEYSVTDDSGSAGQYVIGTFTADATTQSITISGGTDSGSSSNQINALQLRAVPEPSSTALLIGAMSSALLLLRRRT
ncbi:PEP-CTERM sorting domain-containing protein [Coraliomargarita algicola]|uniref:PEP-CTERM sorting domain-containing protein n=1 Tax=Coraliomargarita algicola TaxID=3092156 RepID=A0ABZ0RR52_9BACT|nr:PEP-CTERM sorting domain-containing protein [Coraliomargarita sp. J2-16]WPJ97891.1 PEP-CTERM sorting domain-containing protein [Coraliomargarita sp. J2-16]